MESMWRDLPCSILDKVVTLLPIASLCRFRASSKKWNRLISHPDFASRHRRASSPEQYVLITMRYGMRYEQYDKNPFNVMEGWDVLGVANERFFTLSDDFLTKYVQQEGIAPVRDSWNQRGFLAADGGLFCIGTIQRWCQILQ